MSSTKSGRTMTAVWAMRRVRASLSSTERHLLHAFFSWMSADGFSAPGIAGLIRTTGYTRRTIQLAVHGLERAGLISVHLPQTPERCTVYRVHVDRLADPEEAIQERPVDVLAQPHEAFLMHPPGVPVTPHRRSYCAPPGVPNAPSEDLLRISEDHEDLKDPPNPQGGNGPATSRTPESLPPTKTTPSPIVEVVTPPPQRQPLAFALTPPEPVPPKPTPAAKRTPKARAEHPLAATTSADVASSPRPKVKAPPKPPNAKVPPAERADVKYLRAFDAGIAKGAGIEAFVTPPHGLTRQTLIAIATTHAKRGGELLVGQELLTWFEETAEAFRRAADQWPELKYQGGWTPKGLLAWLNAGRPFDRRKKPRSTPPPTLPPLFTPSGERCADPEGTLLKNLGLIGRIGEPPMPPPKDLQTAFRGGVL